MAFASEGSAMRGWGREAGGEEPIKVAPACVSCPVAAHSEETPKQPKYPCAAGREPFVHGPCQGEFYGDRTCWALCAGVGVCPPGDKGPWLSPLGVPLRPLSPRHPLLSPRTLTASPSLRSTSHQLLPLGSRVQVRPGAVAGASWQPQRVCLRVQRTPTTKGGDIQIPRAQGALCSTPLSPLLLQLKRL